MISTTCKPVISVEGHGEYYEYMRPTVGMKFSFDDFERVIDKFDSQKIRQR